MNEEKANSTANSGGTAASQCQVSQPDVDQAEADYCDAMCLYGRNSAEVLVAHRYWMHLKWLRNRHLAPAPVQHARRRTRCAPPTKQ